MSLINCPECNKEISDKATNCIHCGYPLLNYICSINGVEYNLQNEMNLALVDNDDWIKAIGSLRRKTSLTLSDGSDLIDYIRETKSIPNTFTSRFPLEDREKLYGKPKAITCPTCSSTNIRKMSGVERGASIATFGLFSKKINKTFKCNGCGYTW